MVNPVADNILAKYGKSMTWDMKAGLMGKRVFLHIFTQVFSDDVMQPNANPARSSFPFSLGSNLHWTRTLPKATSPRTSSGPPSPCSRVFENSCTTSTCTASPSRSQLARAARIFSARRSIFRTCLDALLGMWCVGTTWMGEGSRSEGSRVRTCSW